MAALIERDTDIKVQKSLCLEGTFIAFNAIKSGSIDLYVDYTGTLLLTVLKEDPKESTEKNYDFLKKELLKKYQLLVLPSFGFSNAYTFIMRSNTPEQDFSDLKKAKNLRFAFDPEFVIRPEFKKIKKCYDISFPGYRIMDQSLLYLALLKNSIDLIDGDTTDGRILKYNLKTLIDDRNCFSKYAAVPILRKKTWQKYPQLKEVLSILQDSITTEKMQKMNLEVDEGKTPEKVAKAFLLSL